MFFLGYSVFFQGWFMKLVAHLTNVISVDPDAHLLRAMKAGAAGLRSGLILGIFPEGGRSFDGELQTFKKGAAILSQRPYEEHIRSGLATAFASARTV
jgi:long-chain acyl-CoA synthetase